MIDALGLESGAVVVVPYDPRWMDEFAKAGGELEEALVPAIIAVHHVGSTAVPGLCAKPVLDIVVSVPDLTQSLELIPGLEALNYEFRPDEEIPDRHYFRRRRGTMRTHHLSLAEPTSHFHNVTLAFRDALRANAGTAREYCKLKLELARAFPGDRRSYVSGKSAFIAQVLRAAGLEEVRAS